MEDHRRAGARPASSFCWDEYQLVSVDSGQDRAAPRHPSQRAEEVRKP
jgi:hypothetical protein